MSEHDELERGTDPPEYAELLKNFDPDNPDAEKLVPPSERRLVERLVTRAPELRPSLDEHIADNDTVLPHVYFGDLTRWTIVDYQAHSERESGGWRDVVAFLEDEYDDAGFPAQAVIEQSFLRTFPIRDNRGKASCSGLARSSPRSTTSSAAALTWPDEAFRGPDLSNPHGQGSEIAAVVIEVLVEHRDHEPGAGTFLLDPVKLLDDAGDRIQTHCCCNQPVFRRSSSFG